MPKQVMMWEDGQGQLHPSEGAARVANGLHHLREHLMRDPQLNAGLVEHVLTHFQDWHIVYLENAK